MPKGMREVSMCTMVGIFVSIVYLFTNLSAALRIEWCRSRARVMRFWEDIKLLLEEMERVLVFEAWEAGWWREKAERVNARASSLSPELLEGLLAYAERQAIIRTEMRDHFAHLLRFVPQYIAAGSSEIPEQKKDIPVLEDDDDDD